MNDEEKIAYLNQQARTIEAQKSLSIAQQALSIMPQDSEEKANIMELVLNSDKILQRIETFLRKLKPQRVTVNGQSGSIMTEPAQSEKILNERGIHEIMAQLAWYINPDVILSNYTIEEVNEIMFKFSEEFTDFIFINMENFGMDTREKQKHFNMIVTNVINIVDATYHRSIGGRALEALNKSVMVTQSEPLNRGMGMVSLPTQKFNLLKPRTWT